MKPLKLALFFMFLLVLLASCSDRTPTERATARAHKLTYFKDDRTGLCFAEDGWGDQIVLTCVPCDSVTKLLKNK